jgi:DNA-binding CsgD family transcriptional regulator
MAQPIGHLDGSLSPPMLRCLSLLAKGYSPAQIAATLSTSESVIADLIEHARVALAARNRVHAVNIAIRRGLI